MTAKDTYVIALDKLNKLISNNEQDVPMYIWVQNFNEAQLHWFETNYAVDERNKIQIHKLQKVLQHKTLTSKVNRDHYDEFKLPEDYLRYSSSLMPIDDCSKVEGILFEEHNIQEIINNAMWNASIKFEECPVTIAHDKLIVYHNHEFNPENILLYYYRKPVEIDLEDGFNHTDGSPTINRDPEWDDINCYEIIDMAVQTIATNYADQFRSQSQLQHNANNNTK
jgi:hypothetical protein